MRNWINIIEAIHGTEKSDDAPYISGGAYPGSPMAEVFMLYVPHGMRSSGVGKKTYEDWEANLPSNVERVELDAVDYGDGSGDAKPFWERLGFEFKYDGENLSPEAENRMWKGVNGHPTPPVVVVDDDEDY